MSTGISKGHFYSLFGQNFLGVDSEGGWGLGVSLGRGDGMSVEKSSKKEW